MSELLLPPNFRDLGGMPAAGRRVQGCRLLRAGELINLSSEGWRLLKEQYHLRTIVDFRGERELAEAPDPVPEGIRYVHLDLMQNTPASSSSLEDLLRIPDVEVVDAHMEAVYRSMTADPLAQRYLRAFIDILLAQEEGATLFHCFAGKDRTGVAAAVILTILGVSREDIFADYLLTNELRKPHNRPILDVFAAKGATSTQLALVEATLLVKERYLRAAMEAAAERLGSFEGFIVKGLDVTDEERRKLRELYLV